LTVPSQIGVNYYYTSQFITTPNNYQISTPANMGIKGIRTALKVDLNKPANEQPGLHVSSYIRTLVIEGILLNHQ
jgi:hypothetical protein